MKCPACQMENTAEAKFCGNCGHSLTEEVVASGAQEEDEHQARVAPAKETRPNETVEQAKRFASGYFQFFKHALQAPTAIMKSGKVEVRNGIVSLVLICILGACIFYRIMSAAAECYKDICTGCIYAFFLWRVYKGLFIFTHFNFICRVYYFC